MPGSCRPGIRLDSGDLAYLSKEAGKMFAAAGFDDAIISASNDLDENLISGLKLQGSLINSWGVGTNLITSKDSPSMGGVFKLVGQYEGDTFVPKIKLSDNAEKISNPGRKNVFRLYDKDTGKMKADIIALEGETIGTDTAFHLVADSMPMLEPIFRNGKLVYKKPSLSEICDYAEREIETLWPEYLRLINPEEMRVQRSAKLSELRQDVLRKESANFL